MVAETITTGSDASLVTYHYPQIYQGPRPITEQIKKIAEIFGLDPARAYGLAGSITKSLPIGFEGWFAFPKPSALVGPASVFPDKPAYRSATEILFSKIEEILGAKKLRGLGVGRCGAEPYWSQVTIDTMMRLWTSQPGDILVIPAQLGQNYIGVSPKAAVADFTSGEFSLGVFEVGSMLLTHPDRMLGDESLGILCPGDTFDTPVSLASALKTDKGKVWYGACSTVTSRPCYGVASGLIPKT